MKRHTLIFRFAFVFFLVVGGVWAYGSLPADAAPSVTVPEVVQPEKNAIPGPASVTLLVSDPDDLFHLTIEKNILVGTADGLITSDPGGIDCGTTCEADFESGGPNHPDRSSGSQFDLPGLGGRLYRDRHNLPPGISKRIQPLHPRLQSFTP